MKLCKGSYTIEAAFIFPVVLFCICIVIEVGISLYQDVCAEAMKQGNKEPLDLISAMYRRELVKDLFGE